MSILTREELTDNIAEAPWSLLRAHLERGGLIVVASQMDIVDVAYKIAADDVAAIKAWLADGILAKPSGEQIELWDANRDSRFTCLIVSPYVLIQGEPFALQ